MFQFLKNWIKEVPHAVMENCKYNDRGELVKIDDGAFTVEDGSSTIDLTKPSTVDVKNYKELSDPHKDCTIIGGWHVNKDCPNPKAPIQTLEEQTYKIFKATRFHPEINDKAQQKAFFVRCKSLLKDEDLDRVIDEIVTELGEGIILKAVTRKASHRKRNKMLGADLVRKRLKKYADSLEESEEYDKHATI